MSTITASRSDGTASTQDRTCDGCGAPADTRELCLICERSYLSVDGGSADAAIEIIEGAVTAALNGHVSPQDIAAAVAGAIQRMETVPVGTRDELARALGRNRERLDEVETVVSKREAS